MVNTPLLSPLSVSYSWRGEEERKKIGAIFCISQNKPALFGRDYNMNHVTVKRLSQVCMDWIETLAEVQHNRERSNNTKMNVCVCV